MYLSEPHIQSCPHCGWENPMLITSDVIYGSPNCPQCENKTELKPISALPWVEQQRLKLKNLFKF